MVFALLENLPKVRWGLPLRESLRISDQESSPVKGRQRMQRGLFPGERLQSAFILSCFGSGQHFFKSFSHHIVPDLAGQLLDLLGLGLV
ncbi:hypothetical protein HKBW3C_00235 [Candidatus Hakubella thermalkaliphila]|nr:hypothetical protein HKBW3C_00235 [Candidatus Hakubella thermalkaliphila]